LLNAFAVAKVHTFFEKNKFFRDNFRNNDEI